MFSPQNLPKIESSKSKGPLSRSEAFDMLEGYLRKYKNMKDSNLASFHPTWSDLQFACNSLLEDGDTTRRPVSPWSLDMLMSSPYQAKRHPLSANETEENVEAPSETSSVRKDGEDTKTDDSQQKLSKKDKKEAKRKKKEAKKLKKEVKKARKEAKKAKKEAKKRKREEMES